MIVSGKSAPVQLYQILRFITAPSYNGTRSAIIVPNILQICDLQLCHCLHTIYRDKCF